MATGTVWPGRPRWVRPEAPPPERGLVPLWADPRDAPPPGSIGFRAQQQQTFAGPTSAALAAFSSSSRSLGVIREYSLEINNLLASSVITFTLRVNGAAVPKWTYAQFPFSTPHISVSLLEPTDRDYIELPMNAQVDVFVNVADAASYLIGVSYSGWTYPQDLAVYGTPR